MLIWHDNLYMDSKVAADIESYKKIAGEKKLKIAPVYLVTAPSNCKNLLDIVSSNELIFEHYNKRIIEVVGIAHSYKEAVQIVSAIAVEAYHDNGNGNINDSIRKIISENPE